MTDSAEGGADKGVEGDSVAEDEGEGAGDFEDLLIRIIIHPSAVFKPICFQ